MVTGTELTVWIISGMLAVGVGWSRYVKYTTREKMLREFIAMDPERREKVLSRLHPDLQMEIRQELLKRLRVKSDI